MRKLAAALAVALCCGSVSAAPPTPESVERLLAVTKVEAMMDTMFASLERSMEPALKDAGLAPPGK